MIKFAKNIDKPKVEVVVLLFSVFIVGLCTIIYELLIGSISSYFLGDSVKQFSITIGLTMSAMGFGTFLSRLVKNNLMLWFIVIEILLGIVGGLSVPLLYTAFSSTEIYYPIMIVLIFAVGILIGLEIPILTRIMEKHYVLKTNISNVLSLDYFGALLATILFPFVLLPFVGIFSSSLVTGIMNILVGLLNLWWFNDKIEVNLRKKVYSSIIMTFLFLTTLVIYSQSLVRAWENSVFEDRVIMSKQTQYQKIVMTKNKEDVRLYLDGNLQFSAIDEYRYHESLIHVPFSLAKFKENVLILGGGDGLAVREILKYKDVKHITLIDLDPVMTNLAINNRFLKSLNKGSFLNPKVKIVHEDAFKYLADSNGFYDVIIADLPDPNNNALARLYSTEFYKLIRQKLSQSGIFVTQATSPFFAKDAFWCIDKSVHRAEFKYTYPYHVYVPSFGDWGFVMASKVRIRPSDIKLSVSTRYLDNQVAHSLFKFEKDLTVKSIKSSTLDKPEILNYYLKSWKYWN